MRDRRRKLEAESLKKELESTRKERRKRIRDVDLPDSQLCIVCK